MNLNINVALNTLYQRQFSSRKELLNEMLRVKLTQEKLKENPSISENKEQLFQLMKEHTEEELGFFPADRDDFSEIYTVLKDIDLIEFTLEVYKDDRLGTIISPAYLSSYVSKKLLKSPSQKILITEAEKHLAGLKDLLKRCSNLEITLTTQYKLMYLLLKLYFGEQNNLTIRLESIYTECLPGEKFDYIYCLPSFSYKPDDIGREFLTRESDGIALENMLEHLDEEGVLDIILPAKITFAGQGYKKLRAQITENFNVKSIFILPEGTFRPATAIKTYLLTITREQQRVVEIGTFKVDQGDLKTKEQKQISTDEFLAHEDWRVELLLAEDDEYIQKFRDSSLKKMKLKEVAEVFRGKSILKKDTTLGSIGVLNLSNIENGEIDYSGLDTIEEEERKIKRYELNDGDVVLSCRGTAIKSAVFTAQDRTIIASANLLVIRPGKEVLGEYLKIFLESPVGVAMIKSFQRGTTIMNINHLDIMEMEIPLLSFAEQQEIINTYQKELDIYKTAISKAEDRWGKIKNSLYQKLI